MSDICGGVSAVASVVSAVVAVLSLRAQIGGRGPMRSDEAGQKSGGSPRLVTAVLAVLALALAAVAVYLFTR